MALILGALIFHLVVGLPAVAMETTDYIDTNRPSFMFSPLVVPRGSIQVENGTVYQNLRHGGDFFDIPETQVRLGLTKRAEFQMFVPNFLLLQQERDAVTLTGASNINELGIKYQLPALKKFQATLIGSMNLPTGSKSTRIPGVAPVLRLPYSYPIGKWSIMGMQSLLVLNKGRDVQYQPDVMVSYSPTPRIGLFAEYVGFVTHRLPDVNFAHFGAVFKPAHHHQLDAHFGVGLNKAAPAIFVGAGYSYRFDKIANLLH